jgi:N-methylhydantoinase B
MKIDPITLVVVQNSLQHIATEMDLVHQKASFSPIIAESLDRANGIYHRDDGTVIAQGETSLPTFVGVMQFTTQAVIAERMDLHEGDIVVVNDPYFGGTHLMDVKLVKPFFYRGKHWCYLTNSGHWPDIGGMVPGGFATEATEIQQEGLRLPPVRLYRENVLCEDVLRIILSNIRVPDERLGDIRAQVGGLAAGERSLTRLLDRYRVDVVEACIAEFRRRSEIQMRKHIEKIPDGTYSFSSDIDSDGVDDQPLTVALDMTVSGTNIEFDLSRSSPPCRGPMNSVWAITRSAIYIALKHIFPDVPINAGCFAPLHIKKPEGTFLYAEYPRPVSGCAAEVSQRLIEVVLGAFGKAVPHQVVAAPFSSSGNFTLGGWDPQFARNYVMINFSGGGYGASADLDGLSNAAASISAAKTMPLELIENIYPILYEHYRLSQDSGGAGRQRGGLGIDYKMRLLRGDAKASFLMDHGRIGPHGLLGAERGSTNRIELERGGRTETLPLDSKGSGIEMRPGDKVRVITPGGGGYGEPRDRAPALVKRDALRGYISKEQAQTTYGVNLQATETALGNKA